MYIELSLIKNHLNIDAEFTDDDDYLIHLEVACTEMLEKSLNQPLSNLLNDCNDLPTPLKHAILLMIGNFYESRSPISYVSNHELPLSYKYLTSLYKKY